VGFRRCVTVFVMELDAKLTEFESSFDVSPECEQAELRRAAKTSVALDKLVERHGPVTVLAVVQTRDGSVFLQVAEGHPVAGPVLDIGNTNSRYSFPIGARDFVNEWSRGGPSHHCAVGVGHIGGKIEKLGALLGINTRKVC